MPILANIAFDLSFDQIITIIGLIVNSLQALVLPITIYLLVVQTRAMRIQTKEMTAQTRVFIDTVYSATFQSLYDAEAHIGELMMTYPEASRILMTPMSQATDGGGGERMSSGTPLSRHSVAGRGEGEAWPQRPLDSELRERVRWLGTAMLDFFEHIWTQSQKGGLPKDVWEAWEDYISKMLKETRLRYFWQTERGYYSPGFRRFLDLKVGLPPETPAMPPLPRPNSGALAGGKAAETQTPQVARVLRAVTEENEHAP